MSTIVQFLQAMVQKQASDLFFTAGAPVGIKVAGVVHPVTMPDLTAEGVKQLAYELMDAGRVQQFEARNELNFGYSLGDVGRFRVNLYRQRGTVAMVIRRLSSTVPALVDLALPEILGRLAMEKHGLILVVGATGSGKSTTMAAMVEHRNANMPGHILTVEDPVEFVFQRKQAVISQREIGADTESYDSALINALREAPDMIMIGETRDRQTMHHVINYANTGQLCLSSLHAINSHQALTRIVNFFPLDQRNTVLFDLASCLVAIVAQRLVRTVDGKRVAALEIFIVDPGMQQLIREGRLDEIKQRMEEHLMAESQTFDQSLAKLHREGKISYGEAEANADSPRQFHLLIHGEPPQAAEERSILPPLPGDLPNLP